MNYAPDYKIIHQTWFDNNKTLPILFNKFNLKNGLTHDKNYKFLWREAVNQPYPTTNLRAAKSEKVIRIGVIKVFLAFGCDST